MSSSINDNWATTRQAFADQFEQDGTGFIYRRFQKGAAIRVSADERSHFLGEFDRNLRRAMWMMYIGLALGLGGAILFSALRGSDLSQAAFFVGLGVTICPYGFYIYWMWGAPARELVGRSPIAGERSKDEVRRLRFRRMTYGQLGIAALGGLALPFFGSARQDVFSGWNRLWLVFGGALVLFVAIQAFRKWRFDQEESLSGVIPRMSNPVVTDLMKDSTTLRGNGQFWRFVPLAVILLGLPFIAYTSIGKQLAKQPIFGPLVMIALGGWSISTVWRGFTNGQIEPFARGFYNVYQRETQPKRFWASMVWNGLFGGFFFFIAVMMLWQAPQQAIEDRCYNQHGTFNAQNSVDACTDLINGNQPLGYLTRGDAFLYRGLSQARLHNAAAALDDFSEAIRLQPNDSGAYLDRGLLRLDTGNLNAAIADFSRAHDLDAKNVWPLANRGLAYAYMKDSSLAKADFRIVEASDKTNPVMLRGRAVLSINSLNMADAVEYLSASLKSDPDNIWALRTRAWAYRQLGDDQNADADIKRFEKLSGRPAFLTTRQPSEATK